MDNSEQPRNIAVIGAGIMGASIAWRLARRGVQVALIDKGQPGHGASSHSFAWINAGAKEPVVYHNLNRRSLDMWTRFAQAIGDEGDPASVGLRWGGKVSWEAEPANAERLAARVRQLQAWGYPTRLVDARRVTTAGTGPGNRPGGRRRVQPQRRPGGTANGGGRLPAPSAGNGLRDSDRNGSPWL